MFHFYIGQKVVCIRDDWSSYNNWAECFQHPKKDGIYKIRGMENGNVRSGADPNRLYLALEEYLPTILYACENFRPLTDISDLEKLLNVKPITNKQKKENA